MRGIEFALRGFLELGDALNKAIGTQLDSTATVLANPHQTHEREASVARLWAATVGVGPRVLNEMLDAAAVLAEDPLVWHEHKVAVVPPTTFSSLKLAGDLVQLRPNIPANRCILSQTTPAEIILTIPMSSGTALLDPQDIIATSADGTWRAISTGEIEIP